MQNPSPCPAGRPSIWYAALLAACFVGILPAEARPVGVADIRGGIATSDLIVVGRVEHVTLPDGMPTAITDSTSFKFDFAIKPDRVLLGSLPSDSPTLEVHIDTYRGVGDDEYGLFFLRKRPEGGYTIDNSDHPAVVAVPAPPAPDTPPADINAAVARELIAVLATPRKALTDPEHGIRFAPNTDPATEAEHIYEDAVEALGQLPPKTVIEPLRKATASGELLNRLCASEVLFHFGDVSTLAEIAPELMAPPPYAFNAANRTGFALYQVRSVDAIPTLVSLLGSDLRSTRYGAAEALRSMRTASVIVPLAKLAQVEQDPETLTQAILGLCEATHTRSEVCSYETQLRNPAEIREPSREWAKTLLASAPH